MLVFQSKKKRSTYVLSAC